MGNTLGRHPQSHHQPPQRCLVVLMRQLQGHETGATSAELAPPATQWQVLHKSSITGARPWHLKNWARRDSICPGWCSGLMGLLPATATQFSSSSHGDFCGGQVNSCNSTWDSTPATPQASWSTCCTFDPANQEAQEHALRTRQLTYHSVAAASLAVEHLRGCYGATARTQLTGCCCLQARC